MNDTPLTYLKTLYRLLDPDPNSSISMYDVGAAMDLDRDTSNQTAQELMGDGLVEVRTLAGAIGLTPAGLDLLQTSLEAASADNVRLGTEGVVSSETKNVLEKLTDQLKDRATAWNLSGSDHNELFADLETLKAQLISPRPKNTILRATLESLLTQLDHLDQEDPTIERLAELLG